MGRAETNWSLRSVFVPNAGGVMTDEAGAITGELELLTRVAPDGCAVEAMVRYAGAQDLYTVSRNPLCAATPSERSDQEAQHRAAHERVLEALTMPGVVSDGNVMPVDLLGG